MLAIKVAVGYLLGSFAYSAVIQASCLTYSRDGELMPEPILHSIVVALHLASTICGMAG